MRKIPAELECSIDNIIINLCEPLSEIFKKLNFTPNGITTLSLITGLLAVVFLYVGQVWVSVIFYFISYIFDCLDGYYARKYKMCTKFGDLYDHIKDWTVLSLYIGVLLKRNRHKLNKKQWIGIITIFTFMVMTQTLYFACQERYYDNLDQIPSLRWVGKIIKTKETSIKYLRFVRHFGVGTFIVLFILFVLYLELKE